MMSLVSMTYAALLLTEGVGLWFDFSWSAYLPVISTSLLLPFELYEVIERITAVRIRVLLLNLVIVLYLVYQFNHHSLLSRHHSNSPLRFHPQHAFRHADFLTPYR